MTDIFLVPDGLDELKQKMPMIIDLIARTARWVHPDAFRALPVWYPETARGEPIYDSKWTNVYKNKNRSSGEVTDKSEPNIKGGKAFVSALGSKKTDNWSVCHIWGVDDPKFQRSNRVVRDRTFYSCVGNMVWLPTPFKGFTDAVPEVRRMLRTCAFHLYCWACEHQDVASQVAEVRSGNVPEGYPETWPTHGVCYRPGPHRFLPVSLKRSGNGKKSSGECSMPPPKVRFRTFLPKKSGRCSISGRLKFKGTHALQSPFKKGIQGDNCAQAD